MGWQAVWEDVHGLRNHADKSRSWTRRGAIRWGNRMANSYGWGPFCVRRFVKPVKVKNDYFTGICE